VTYLFIGVIPVALIAAIVLLGGYLIASQFAIFLASDDIHTEVDNLQQANAELAGRLADAARRGVPLSQPGILQQELAVVSRTFPRLQVTAAFRNKSETLGSDTKLAGSRLPGWLHGQFAGLVEDADHTFHLRAVTLTPVGNDILTVQTSVPVDASEMARIGRNLGQISLIHGDVEADHGKEGNVSGGSVPQAFNTVDLEIPFLNEHFPVVRWDSGGSQDHKFLVGTRLSVLYSRLFLTSSDFATKIKTALFGTALVFALIELVALIIGVRLTRTITQSVAALYEATELVNRGEFSHRIEVRERDQLAALETSFNSMTTSLEKLLAEQKEKQRLESELAIAQEVQGQLFPRVERQMASLEVHGTCRPARTVSGDYYDFLPLGIERMGIAVGDISGKGISAALLMATVHSAVRVYEFGGLPDRAAPATAAVAALAGSWPKGARAAEVANGGNASAAHSPREVLWLLNRHLFHSTPPEKYATMFLGIFDGNNRRLTYSNAGHLPPMILSPGGDVRRLDAGGTVIGLLDNISYEEKSVELRSQDLFVAYSDGVTEPENEFGEFGEGRLLEILQANRHLPLPRLSEIVTAAVLDWMSGAEQPDDVTLVLARAR
jgi:sigma-B regulation protein RsbU (phosphoserine phosphatase)